MSQNSSIFKKAPAYTFKSGQYTSKQLLSKDLTGDKLGSFSPGVGKYYSDYLTSVKRRAPEYKIGTSPKENHYQINKHNSKSPGPKYKYSLPYDVASPNHQNAVFLYAFIHLFIYLGFFSFSYFFPFFFFVLFFSLFLHVFFVGCFGCFFWVLLVFIAFFSRNLYRRARMLI
jgi:hypothetical protein